MYMRLKSLQAPIYVVTQAIGSTLASLTLRLLFTGKDSQFPGTQPAGSDAQAFVVEFIITFYLMFVISGAATDNRAVSLIMHTHRDMYVLSLDITSLITCFNYLACREGSLPVLPSAQLFCLTS